VQTVTLRCTAVTAVLLAVAGCASDADSSPTVSKDALQRDIADRLIKGGQTPQSVNCRDDLVGEIGRTARCDVVITATNSFQPIVTVTGVSGGVVDYEMKPALSQPQLEAAVARMVAAGGPPPAVACESGLVGDVGATAYCDIDSSGSRGRHAVRATRVDGLTIDFTLSSG
jgi:hypothetical protein